MAAAVTCRRSSGPVISSFSKSISSVNSINAQPKKTVRRTCMCSPTTHPGSFRCALHKNVHHAVKITSSSPSNQLNLRKSTVTNSFARKEPVRGEIVKRFLRTLINPSSNRQPQRGVFKPRPSRLSVMSKAEDM